MAQAKQDMGSGSVKKLMLQLMIPAVVAQVVNLLYNKMCIRDRCDTSHQIEREGAQTMVFDKGIDSVDFALVNRVKPGDAVSYTHLVLYGGKGIIYCRKFCFEIVVDVIFAPLKLFRNLLRRDREMPDGHSDVLSSLRRSLRPIQSEQTQPNASEPHHVLGF